MGTVGLASAALNSAVWASPFPAVPKGQRPGFSTVWPLEIPISKCLFQRSGLQRNSFRLLCRLLTSPPRSRALQLAQSAFPDATEISRGKIDRLPCRPPDLPPRPSMTVDFAITCSLVRSGRPRYPVLVHRAADLLHTFFRPHLAMTPLRFANPSPSSGWIEDFHLQAVDHARHTRERRGSCNPRLSKNYQPFRKHCRPYGPVCQPGGQLYIGRQPP